jgi:integrase
MSADEVRLVLAQLDGEYWLIASLLYGSGLRLMESLRLHLERVQQQHRSAGERGHAGVELPHALARRYPNAHLEWTWQYVFPARHPCRDPRTGVLRRHHIHEASVQRHVRAAVCAGMRVTGRRLCCVGGVGAIGTGAFRVDHRRNNGTVPMRGQPQGGLVTAAPAAAAAPRG